MSDFAVRVAIDSCDNHKQNGYANNEIILHILAEMLSELKSIQCFLLHLQFRSYCCYLFIFFLTIYWIFD